MNTYVKNILGTAIIATAAVSLSACKDDASVASYNISKAADQFEINRRIVFYNGITDKYILAVEGLCSITKDAKDAQLEVVCKDGANSFKKHFLGISDNVTYFAEQLEPANVSVYHYRVIFKPQSIIPDVEIRGSMDELTNNIKPPKLEISPSVVK